jgi:hypothetical protein
MSSKYVKVAIILAIIVAVAVAVPAFAAGPGGGGGGGGGGGHTEVATNNLSFPAIAADGSTITDVAELFTVPYLNPDGSVFTIPGEDPAFPWYAQKVDGNKWNADFRIAGATEAITVLGVDWGDNIESVNPALRRPYRLETALFVDVSAEPAPMLGYRMGMLANPSSPDEIQGTNTARYESDYATIYSTKPGLRIQNISSISDPSTLEWDPVNYYWTYNGTRPPATTISFAPELNVAGKYIFGASTGGWKPTALGTYRITFYIPLTTSSIRMDADDPTSPDDAYTTLGNLVDGVWIPGVGGEEGDGGVATPILDVTNNLTYVDVQVIAKGGGGGKPQ